MANRFFSLPLFLLLLITAAATLSSAAAPPSQSPETQDNDQFNKIIDALIGAGDFAGWANVLSTTDPSTLPLTATFFIPTNDAVSDLTGANIVDPFLIPYHIVPQRLTFADLKHFPTRTRLPTLLPFKYVVVTSNSSDNFTVDDSQIIHPDIYENAAFAVHGIKNVMDYSAFGDGGRVVSPPPPAMVNNTSSLRPKSRPEKKGSEFPSGTTLDLSDGGDSCKCDRLWKVAFAIWCAQLLIHFVLEVIVMRQYRSLWCLYIPLFVVIVTMPFCKGMCLHVRHVMVLLVLYFNF